MQFQITLYPTDLTIIFLDSWMNPFPLKIMFSDFLLFCWAKLNLSTVISNNHIFELSPLPLKLPGSIN